MTAKYFSYYITATEIEQIGELIAMHIKHLAFALNTFQKFVTETIQWGINQELQLIHVLFHLYT